MRKPVKRKNKVKQYFASVAGQIKNDAIASLRKIRREFSGKKPEKNFTPLRPSPEIQALKEQYNLALAGYNNAKKRGNLTEMAYFEREIKKLLNQIYKKTE